MAASSCGSRPGRTRSTARCPAIARPACRARSPSPKAARLVGRLAKLAARLGYRRAGRGLGSLLDLLWVAWLAWIFDAINDLGAVRQGLAEHHGSQVLAVERSLRLAPELGLNAAVAGHRLLREIDAAWYDVAHGAITFGLIFWLWWRRAELLPPLRAALIGVNLVAQAVFWTWPVAPPRMLPSPQFVDVIAVVGGRSPHWPPGAVSLYANQLSAFPSLHLAWAVWSAVVLWRLSRRRWVRALATIYPFVTLLAVMSTANHYLADGVTGAALALVMVAACDWVFSRARPARAA